MTRTITGNIAVLLLLWFPAAVLAQSRGTNDPDSQEVRAYRLTMATMTKVMQAARDMAEAAKKDPRFAKVESLNAEIKKLQEKDDLTEAEQTRLQKLEEDLEAAEQGSSSTNKNAETLSEMVAQIKSEPIAAAALARAGLDAREFAKFTLAALQAGMVAGMLKSGVVKQVPPDLAATVNMENVKFMQEHEAEFEAFAKAMGNKQ
jgi:hypothetical protein